MTRDEVHRAIPVLEDLTRVFKRIDGVARMQDEGQKPKSTDAAAPIPQDGEFSKEGKVDAT